MYQKPINLSNLFKRYINKWVAFDDEGKVVSYGNSLKVALHKAQKQGYAEPTVMKIPDTRYSLAL
jgi:hypothetical protein